MSVTAEGVETYEQADLLAELGSDHLQGYRFSRPLGPARCRVRHAPTHRQPLTDATVSVADQGTSAGSVDGAGADQFAFGGFGSVVGLGRVDQATP